MCTQKNHKKEDEPAKSHVVGRINCFFNGFSHIIRLNFGQKIGIKNKTSSSSYRRNQYVQYKRNLRE